MLGNGFEKNNTVQRRMNGMDIDINDQVVWDIKSAAFVFKTSPLESRDLVWDNIFRCSTRSVVSPLKY